MEGAELGSPTPILDNIWDAGKLSIDLTGIAFTKACTLTVASSAM